MSTAQIDGIQSCWWLLLYVVVLQVVIADRFAAGPFKEIWQRMSDPFPVVSLSSFAHASQPTCFTSSIHAHYAPPNKAFLGYEGVGAEHTCPSHILMAAAHWQRYLFKEILPSAERREYEVLEHTHLNGGSKTSTLQHTPASAQQRRLHVVWLSRSWFGRSMRAGGGLTGWQASRDLPHSKETEIVKALEQAVLDWNSQACVEPTFGWWQKPHNVPPQTGCKPSRVAFDFRVSGLQLTCAHCEL